MHLGKGVGVSWTGTVVLEQGNHTVQTPKHRLALLFVFKRHLISEQHLLEMLHSMQPAQTSILQRGDTRSHKSVARSSKQLVIDFFSL